MTAGVTLKPKIFGMRTSVLFDLYRWQLRDHLMQELLAGMGIATGVALLFGVLVANTSLTGAAGEVVHAVTGRASLELVARSPNGFDEQTAAAASELPGVRVASRILDEDASIVGPKGHQLVQVFGVTPSLMLLHARATKDLGAGNALVSGGVGLPTAVASRVGARSGGQVTILAGGETHTVPVRAVLGEQAIGPVADSPLVLALLSTAQDLTGKAERVTQLLVEPRPGATRQVELELRRLAAGRLDVEPADHELSLLDDASRPTSQSTLLFAAISAMVGFLLALNAMLLTVPERRRFVAELRTQGFGPKQVVTILAFQAATLGITFSLLGVAIGASISHALFSEVPSYLAFAFPIGSHQIIRAGNVFVAVGCGALAALLAALVPMLDMLPHRTADAVLHEFGEAGNGIAPKTIFRLGGAGVVVAAVVAVAVSATPSLAIVGGVLLALAALCLIPATCAAIAALIESASERARGSMLALAVLELRATATRSIALASVAALAVYGSVAMQGAKHDLTTGLDAAVTQYLDTADAWITTGENVFTTDSFRASGAAARIARTAGVASVRIYQGALLDVAGHRIWIRGRPAADGTMLQSSQLLKGDYATATRQLREGGWAAISSSLASERHVGIGDSFTLPTPSGSLGLRVAAITTNAGWPGGAITMSASTYRAGWQTVEPSALEVNFKPGTSPRRDLQNVRAALGYHPGLSVQSRGQREAQFRGSLAQGLRSLGQISTLLLLIAALSVAFALSAAIWQRRERLSSLKAQGFDSHQLWRSLLLESTIVLGVGCLDGVLFGIAGHATADRWLKLSTGFPAPFSIDLAQIGLTVLLVGGVALAVVAAPGLIAARVSPRASFEE